MATRNQPKPKLSYERLIQVLDIDPHTGICRWRISPRYTRIAAGSVAGGLEANGYWVIRVDGRMYKAHVLVWFYVHREWPPELDHRDTIRHHNWIDNLRQATRSQNGANRSRCKSNASGYKGVYVHRGKWRSQIQKDGRLVFIGYFPTAELAHSAYLEKAKELHGRFANPGT